MFHPKHVELFAGNKVLYKGVVLLEHFNGDIKPVFSPLILRQKEKKCAVGTAYVTLPPEKKSKKGTASIVSKLRTTESFPKIQVSFDVTSISK
jgi:hypothetical protein